MSSNNTTHTTFYLYCDKCGKPKWTYQDSSATLPVCTCEAEKPEHQLQGWICPVCGRGVSPFASTCNHGKFDYTVTS